MKKIRLQGIPYDAKSSFLRGAAKAPDAIRKAFLSEASNLYAENGLEINPAMLSDAGDFGIDDYFDITRVSLENLSMKLPLISLGGDHSITYPIIKAIHRNYGPVDILHLDAHSDLYDSFNGDRYSHACPFARIMEEGLASGLTQVGIRTLTEHQREQAKKFGVQIFPIKDWQLSSLPNFKKPLYISLDLDALDPSCAPGVSHHEPGGFSTRDVISIIQQIKAPILGADIVEYNPDRDINGTTAMVCAKFLKEIASMMLANSNGS